jgi:hypothetical protein
MTESRERVFRMAMVAVLQAAGNRGLDTDRLAEESIELMLNDIAYSPEEVAQAVIAIEVAADAVT